MTIQIATVLKISDQLLVSEKYYKLNNGYLNIGKYHYRCISNSMYAYLENGMHNIL